MDITLYGIAISAFAVLYIVLSVFLAYALVITLLVMFLYLALRHGNLAENYPYGGGEAVTTVIFIGITWALFTFFGPKNPIPFMGNGLTYASGAAPIGAVLVIVFALAVSFLVIFSFFPQVLGDRSGGATPPAGGDSKPKQGVGA
jgi:phosphatidylglycerophosphate synthase